MIRERLNFTQFLRNDNNTPSRLQNRKMKGF